MQGSTPPPTSRPLPSRGPGGKGSPNFMGLEQLKANGLGAMPKDVGTPLHFAIAFGVPDPLPRHITAPQPPGNRLNSAEA